MKTDRIQAKAGRFVFDKETKKVKLSKEKGLLSVYKNQDGETYFSWASLDDNVEHISLMVFPNDAIFQGVVGKNNTFVLRAETDDDRYFFWLQEKTDSVQLVQGINTLINSMEQEEPQKMEEEEPQKDQKPQPMEAEGGSQTANKPVPSVSDFISRMQKNLEAATKNMPKAITHLNEIVTATAIGMALNETSEEEKKEMAEFLPETQQDTKFLSQNIRSPQFLQALDALSDALNSENAISLFMEMGLDQKFLQKHYGVEAFIRALEDWGNKQLPKVEEAPKKQ